MADLDDLKREWDSQPVYSEERMNEIANLVRTRSDSMRSTLFACNQGEALLFVFIILAFGSFWFFAPNDFAPNAISKAGIAIIIAGCVGSIVLTQVVQRRGRVDFTSVPLKEFLSSEVRHLNRQISFLRHVAWWYELPYCFGVCVFVIGIGLRDWEDLQTWCISFCVGYFVLSAFFWWLSQRGSRKIFEPLRDAMQRTYDSLAAMDSDSAEPNADLVSALADPALDIICGTPNWNLVRPSWREAIVITLATLGGAYCGLRYPIHDMGPELFQAMVGATIAFEIALVCIWLRRRSNKE